MTTKTKQLIRYSQPESFLLDLLDVMDPHGRWDWTLAGQQGPLSRLPRFGHHKAVLYRHTAGLDRIPLPTSSVPGSDCIYFQAFDAVLKVQKPGHPFRGRYWLTVCEVEGWQDSSRRVLRGYPGSSTAIGAKAARRQIQSFLDGDYQST